MAASTKEVSEWIKQLRNALDIQKTQASNVKSDSSLLLDDDEIQDMDD